MELLQLRYFYESAIAESFSKTAKKHMVPVSSVSASVKRLEQELGTELFVRTGNRILLNEKGRQFLSVVRNTLSQLDLGVSALSTVATQKQTLHILARWTRQTIVRQILNFHKMYPSVYFKVAFEDRPENYEKYDVIISTPNEALVDYAFFPWKRYAVRIEALETDPLCQRTVTLSQLRDRLFVTTNAQRGSFRVFAQACREKGFTPKVLLECDDYTCRDMAVLSGSCLGLTLGKSTNSGMPNVQYLKVSDFDEYIVSNLYYRKEEYNGNRKLFIDFLKQSVQ